MGASNKKKDLGVADYVKGVLDGDCVILAQAITLVESNAATHKERAQAVIKELLPHTGKSVRIGVTGLPGSGKSSLIESLGVMLCEQEKKVAVLAVDPSSSLTGGSILGDKTRMERLSSHANSFIRPSPSGGIPGGVNRKTRETILLCEAAGFDLILVETVGVGQSEVMVRSMVDFFLLLTITGAGDELQSIKKGIIELADAIVVNKADGENKLPARRAAEEFNRVLHYLSSFTPGWKTKAFPCSAVSGEGIEEIWKVISKFDQVIKASGRFEQQRQEQMLDWVDSMVMDKLKLSFFEHPEVKRLYSEIKEQVVSGTMPATAAADKLFAAFK